ncbi:hypothetical protein [Pusillimonas noertemannii]|uniref:Uncharacterized protein n=1 Tax=Pusillimonas noertemannii TaxID=305977 RepID=A0A2U1CN70_9BURK|nr:hypothetical protein [Pusillimonas noertemannii]NYT68599.1 hypothetical protein [Pusillimonas noertemannii]PVY62384.1 hypothetical protein C7440_1877 [Pusillimonas noertemannii]
MSATQKTLAPYRTWKVKPYSLPLETRLAQERAQQAQPPMISLHSSKQSKKEEKAAA